MARFDKYLETMLGRATKEAQLAGSTTVEAQHLLLAVAADRTSAAGQLLASAGLDRDAIRKALDREFERSLGAAGVTSSAFGIGPATPDPREVPRPANSVRLALERGLGSGARKDLRSTDLLLGILEAEVGTVPRALALAGADRADLMARARTADLTDDTGR
jgi:D-alanyl-D-alanine carboxypeptidase